jgi:hypothetical protein
MSDCGKTSAPCGPCGGGSGGVVWTIKQGALLSHRLHVINKAKGSSFDLTGYGVRGYLRHRPFDESYPALAEFVGEVISPATSGKIRVKLGATVTRRLWDRGYFDVEVYKLDDPDIVYRVYQGQWVVDLEITTG